jgi:hypothetical protein
VRKFSDEINIRSQSREKQNRAVGRIAHHAITDPFVPHTCKADRPEHHNGIVPDTPSLRIAAHPPQINSREASGRRIVGAGPMGRPTIAASIERTGKRPDHGPGRTDRRRVSPKHAACWHPTRGERADRGQHTPRHISPIGRASGSLCTWATSSRSTC